MNNIKKKRPDYFQAIPYLIPAIFILSIATFFAFQNILLPLHLTIIGFVLLAISTILIIKYGSDGYTGKATEQIVVFMLTLVWTVNCYEKIKMTGEHPVTLFIAIMGFLLTIAWTFFIWKCKEEPMNMEH